MKLIAIAAVLALVAGGVDVEAQKRGDQEGSRDHKLIVTGGLAQVIPQQHIITGPFLTVTLKACLEQLPGIHNSHLSDQVLASTPYPTEVCQ